MGYTWDGNGRVATRTHDDNIDSFGYTGNGLDLTKAGDVKVGVDPFGTPISTSAGVSTVNTHGDTVAATNADGTLTPAGFDPFGNPTRAGPRTQVGFQSDFTDPATGEVWMGARFYQPSTGTFTSRDTWAGNPEMPVTLNRYSYANNDPVNHTDPTGHWATKEQLYHFYTGTYGLTRLLGMAMLMTIGPEGAQTLLDLAYGGAPPGTELAYAPAPTVAVPKVAGTITETAGTGSSGIPAAGAATTLIIGTGVTTLAVAVTVLTVLNSPSQRAYEEATDRIITATNGPETTHRPGPLTEGTGVSEDECREILRNDTTSQQAQDCLDTFPNLPTEPTPTTTSSECTTTTATEDGPPRYVIGGMEDLGPGSLRPGEVTVASKLPGDAGNRLGNWLNNRDVLLCVMREGRPIRDASTDSAGNLLYEDSLAVRMGVAGSANRN